MAKQTTDQSLSLTLKRTFPASREKVFRAWTDPQALKEWWGPEGYQTTWAEVDLRVGGRYRLGMKQLPDGDVFYKSGTYREVEPPERIVCTWQWESPDMDVGEALLTVEFVDRGGETEIVLKHELFRDAEQRDRHYQGWISLFDCLTEFLTPEASGA